MLERTQNVQQPRVQVIKQVTPSHEESMNYGGVRVHSHFYIRQKAIP